MIKYILNKWADMREMKINQLLKNTFIKSSVFLSIGLISILIILVVLSASIPDYKFLKNYKLPISSKVYSGEGELVADFSTEKRIFVPYSSIPKNVINAFLSAEDKNFFSHSGIDLKGIIRAIKNNISNFKSSKRLEGASTITQQVAKNLLLTNEISYKRKIKEAILALRIERVLSKERILELYLNQIYLGSGAYGVAAASLEYFDKSIEELNYAEAALLAALPRAPSRYNPYRDIDTAKFRRDIVLKNLLDNNYIDYNTYEELLKTNINLNKSEKVYLEDSQYYIEDIRKNIIEKLSYDKVYKEGLNINTPINLELQKVATLSLRAGLIEYDKRKGWRGVLENKEYSNNWFNNLEKFKLEKSINWQIAIVKKIDQFSATIETEDNLIGKIENTDIAWTNRELKNLLKIGDIIYVEKIQDDNFTLRQLPLTEGAIIVMDPYTGRVLALAGGFSFKQSEFNRATQALRQPGSAFKPFVYALALENEYNPSSLVLDAPLVINQGPGLKLWKPENYGKEFYGLTTLRSGLEKSRNLMTVRIAQNLGADKIAKFSQEMGIYDNPDELISISLGSGETTLLKLTNAYASFVNGGKLVEPILIDRIQDSEGNTILNNYQKKCINCDLISFSSNDYPEIMNNYKQVISSQTAYQITSILEGAIQRGTGQNLKELNLNLAGKTGTTNDNIDTWFIGFTSNLLIGVYVGNDNPSSLGKNETGARTALPIFKKFVSKVVKKPDARPFKVPDGTVMILIDLETGKKAEPNTINKIVEVYKTTDVIDRQTLNFNNDRFNNINIFKFY